MSLEKTVQIITVWVIPFLGGIGLWLFNKNQDSVKFIPKEFGEGKTERVSSVDADLGSD